MRTIRENFIPALILISAAFVVALASIPLQNTEWADGIRAGVETGETVAGAEVESSKASPPDIGIAIYFLPMIKVFLLMGIGALFTWIARLIIRFGSNLFPGDQKTATD